MSWAAGRDPAPGEAVSHRLLEGTDSLRGLLGDDGFRDLVRLFLQEGHRRLEALGESFARHDATGAAREAHAFKGCCASFGARRLAALCASLEAGTRSGHLDGDAFAALAGSFCGIEQLLRHGQTDPCATAPAAVADEAAKARGDVR